MVRGWVFFLGIAWCVGVLHGQDVAGEDLQKVQSAWGATVESETLKMVRESETNVDIGVPGEEPVTSTDSMTVQIRNNGDGTTDVYAVADIVRETSISAEMVIWNEENFIRLQGTDLEGTAEEWISGEKIAELRPAGIDEIIDPSITIKEVEDIINPDYVESIEKVEERDVNGITASCYELTPTPEHLTKLSPDATDVTSANEICIDEASGKLVSVIGSIEETIALEGQEEGDPSGLVVATSYTYTFSDFGIAFEFPKRFTEEAEIPQEEQAAQEEEEPEDDVKSSAISATVSFLPLVGAVLVATFL